MRKRLFKNSFGNQHGQVGQFNNQYSQVNNQCEQFNNQHSQVNNQCEQLNNQHSQVNNQFNNQYDQFNNQHSQVNNQFNNQYDQFNNQHSQVSTQVGQFNNQYEQFNNQHSQVNNQCEQFNNQYDQFNNQHSQVSTQVGQFNTQVGQYEQFNNQHSQVNNQCEQLNNQYSQVNDQFNNQCEQFNNQYGQVNNQVDQFINHQSQFNNQHGQVNNQADQFIDRQSQFNNQHGQVNNQVGQFNNHQGQVNNQIGNQKKKKPKDNDCSSNVAIREEEMKQAQSKPSTSKHQAQVISNDAILLNEQSRAQIFLNIFSRSFSSISAFSKDKNLEFRIPIQLACLTASRQEFKKTVSPHTFAAACLDCLTYLIIKIGKLKNPQILDTETIRYIFKLFDCLLEDSLQEVKTSYDSNPEFLAAKWEGGISSVAPNIWASIESTLSKFLSFIQNNEIASLPMEKSSTSDIENGWNRIKIWSEAFQKREWFSNFFEKWADLVYRQADKPELQ